MDIVSACAYDSNCRNRDNYLLVDDSSETSLTLDDGVWDAHLAAEGRQEDDELNGVDVVGDQNK